MKGKRKGNGVEKREGGKWGEKGDGKGGGRKWSPQLSECGCASATRPKTGGVWTPWTPMD